MTKIILVRHGQTEWNRNERFRGHADIPLNATGKRQAEATGKRVASEWRPSAIYTSPLSRAVDTGQAIADHLAKSFQARVPVQAIPDLSDIDYGDWQGLTPEEARLRWPTEINAWYISPQTVHIPSGESLEDLRLRAMRVVGQLIERHAEETIAIVGHTVINRVILLGMLGLGNERFWHLRQDTCAINLIEAENGAFTLATMNDTCHLRRIE